MSINRLIEQWGRPDCTSPDSCSGFVSGTSTFMIQLWGIQSDPYQQGLHFIGKVGTVICPQMVKPFLADTIQDAPVRANPENCTTQSCIVPNGTKEIFDNSSDTELDAPFHSRVYLPFLIVGIAAVCGGCLHMANLWHSGCNLQPIIDVKLSPTTARPHEGRKQYKWYNFTVVFFLCSLNFLSGALEENFSAFTVNLTVNNLSWNKNDASNLLSVWAASFTVSRLISTVASRCVQAKVLMAVYSSISVAATVLMTCAVNLTSLSLWIGGALVGLGTGSTTGTVICMGKNILKSSGIVSSFALVSAYSGKIATPLLIGYVLESASYMWFFHISLVYAIGMLTSFMLVLCVDCVQDNRKKQWADRQKKETEIPLAESADV